jgi:hypothetical protein
VGVALRIAGDLGGSFRLAQRGALIGAIAIGVVLVATIGSAVVARLSRRGAAAVPAARRAR